MDGQGGSETVVAVYVDGFSEPTNPGLGTYGYVVYRNGNCQILASYKALFDPRSDEGMTANALSTVIRTKTLRIAAIVIANTISTLPATSSKKRKHANRPLRKV